MPWPQPCPAACLGTHGFSTLLESMRGDASESGQPRDTLRNVSKDSRDRFRVHRSVEPAASARRSDQARRRRGALAARPASWPPRRGSARAARRRPAPAPASAAAAPISISGCRTVVSGGPHQRAYSRSSKPTTLRSSGMRSPSLRGPPRRRRAPAGRCRRRPRWAAGPGSSSSRPSRRPSSK